MDVNDLARAMFPKVATVVRDELQKGLVPTYTVAYAMSDSSDGRVTVSFGGGMGSAAVEVPTEVAVKDGDRVSVRNLNGKLTVAGVVGRGDEIASDASAAKADASTAKADASQAKSDAATAKTNASSAVSTANAASNNASSALTKANTAASDASTAKTNAASAVSTANAANSNASKAVTTANTASSNASAAVTTANSAKSTADNLATLIRQSSAGVEVGKTDASGAWQTNRALVSSAGDFQVLAKDGTQLARFASDVVELGRNSQNAVIKLCGGLVGIKAVGTAGTNNKTVKMYNEGTGSVYLGGPDSDDRGIGVYRVDDGEGKTEALNAVVSGDTVSIAAGSESLLTVNGNTAQHLHAKYIYSGDAIQSLGKSYNGDLTFSKDCVVAFYGLWNAGSSGSFELNVNNGGGSVTVLSYKGYSGFTCMVNERLFVKAGGKVNVLWASNYELHYRVCNLAV